MEPSSRTSSDSTGGRTHSPMELRESPASSRNPTPPSLRSSPLAPLPAEVFLLMIKHIEPHNRYSLTRVAKSWYIFLTQEPSIWPNLHGINLLKDQDQLIQLWATRSPIKSIEISLPNQRQESSKSPLQRLQKLTESLTRFNIPIIQSPTQRPRYGIPPLRSLTLFLDPSTVTAFEVILNLAHSARALIYSQLSHIHIQTHFHSFHLVHAFFAIWHSPISITIINEPYESTATTAIPRLDWALFNPVPYSDGQLRPIRPLQNLIKLDLRGLAISHPLSLTWMPQLAHITLVDVSWIGRSFFLLMRIVRKSLVSLECINFTLLEVEGRELEDWTTNVMIRQKDLIDDHIFDDNTSDLSTESTEVHEVPPSIIFTKLERLVLAGEETTPFFASLEAVESVPVSSTLPTPIFVMPRLRIAHFTNLSADLESFPDEGEGSLATFGRNAPNLIDFSIAGSYLSDLALFHCLAGMSSKLEKLNLSSTTISDKLITSLPALLPQLRELEVLNCEEISIQGIARCVELMQDPVDEKRKLRVVRIDRPFYESELMAWRWLDFIGVLERDDFDQEGFGPIYDEEAMKQWKKEGKWDQVVVDRKRREEKIEKEKSLEKIKLERIRTAYGFVPSAPTKTETAVVATEEGSGGQKDNLVPVGTSSFIKVIVKGVRVVD